MTYPTPPSPYRPPPAGPAQLGPCASCQAQTPKYGAGTGPLCAECLERWQAQQKK